MQNEFTYKQYKAIFDEDFHEDKDLENQIEIIENSLFFDDFREPHRLIIFKSLKTGNFYKIINFHDSWDSADFEPVITRVELKQIMKPVYEDIETLKIDYEEES